MLYICIYAGVKVEIHPRKTTGLVRSVGEGEDIQKEMTGVRTVKGKGKTWQP